MNRAMAHHSKNGKSPTFCKQYIYVGTSRRPTWNNSLLINGVYIINGDCKQEIGSKKYKRVNYSRHPSVCLRISGSGHAQEYLVLRPLLYDLPVIRIDRDFIREQA